LPDNDNLDQNELSRLSDQMMSDAIVRDLQQLGFPVSQFNYLATAYPEAEMDSLDADQLDSLPEFYHYLPKQDNSEPTPLSQAHSQASLVRTTTPPAALSAKDAK
jgi:hypothetical protein